MSFVSLLLALAIFGFLVWVVLQIPMPQVFKNIILGVVSLFLIIWVLQLFGVATDLPRMKLY